MGWKANAVLLQLKGIARQIGPVDDVEAIGAAAGIDIDLAIGRQLGGVEGGVEG